MLANDEDRLRWKVVALNSGTSAEVTNPARAFGLSRCEGLYPRSSKALRSSAFGDEISKTWTCKEIAGPSSELRRVMATLRTIAQTDSAILVFGEKGTCKEVIARSLHALSHYSHFPFIHVNCELARPEEIFSALTVRTRRNSHRPQSAFGGFHLAAGKTVFLEGISTLSSEAQLAILQILRSADWDLQETSSLAPKRIRLIASSDVDLLEATRMGVFSSDLYRHLDMLSIRIPALRERAEDIPMLVHSFLELYSEGRGEAERFLSAKAMEALQLYPWPGNLRELWHVMDRFTTLRQQEESSHLRQPSSGDEALQWPVLPVNLEDAELLDCELIITALLQTFSLRPQER